MPLPEVALWAVLRQRPGGLKFRRNHPIGDELALDFYCNDARQAIEVDGEAHSRGDRPVKDAARDVFLRAHGIETLRVPAVEVLRDLDAVMRGILAACVARLPLHHPAARGVSGRSCPRHDLGSPGAIPPDTPPPRDKLGED